MQLAQAFCQGIATAALLALPAGAMADPAAEWSDPLTGHKVVRISREPGSASLYFHQNSYTPQGDKMVISVPGGISVVDLKSWEVTPLVRGKGLILLFTGRKTRTAYYQTRAREGAPWTIFAADIDSGKTSRIAEIKEGFVGSINADETLLLGQWAETDRPLQPGAKPEDNKRFDQAHYAANWPDGTPMTYADAKEVRLNERLEAKIPMEIFTIDVKTGVRKVVTASTD